MRTSVGTKKSRGHRGPVVHQRVSTAAITPEMIEACIETGERLAAAVGILKSHLSRVLEICGPSAEYPGATKKQIEDARRALNDMRALPLDAWIRRHVREAGLAA